MSAVVDRPQQRGPLDWLLDRPGVSVSGEARQAGEQAKWYVRGGMDPNYADPAERDAQAVTLARLGRGDLSSALLLGWVNHRHQEVPA